MQIYLVRHGDAIDRALAGVRTDDERWLTDEGREEVGWTARLLAKLEVEPDLILSSPLVRAVQTAEIIRDVTGPAREPALSEHLIHGGSFAGVLNDIASHGSPRKVVLCGHMPSIGEMVGWLAWNERLAGPRMRTGAVARVDLPDDSVIPGWGDLRWLIPPKTARRLLDL